MKMRPNTETDITSLNSYQLIAKMKLV